MNERERLASMTYPDPNSGCFIFAGACQRREGKELHGRIQSGSRREGNYKIALAHCVAWELENGPVPAGLFVLHKCNTPCCVNPDHLYLGTIQDNALDMMRSGGGTKSRKGLPYGVRAYRGHFWAEITVRRQHRYLGVFATVEAAAEAARQAKNQALAERKRPA